MFYTLTQNNSGGTWDFNAKNGISHFVVIEARSESEAKYRAEAAGVYWDGCSTGRDCSCCGDRWSDYFMDGETEPSVYSKVVKPGALAPSKDEETFFTKWMGEGNPEGFIHYLDGRIESFWSETAPRTELEGQHGWGVQFNKFEAKKFVCDARGWDETGNYASSWGWDRRDKKPKKAEVKVNETHSFGNAWFPTEAEADEFVAGYKKAKAKVKRSITALLKTFDDDEYGHIVAEVWRRQ